jgi:8-hydroxy-5-deazaflavin:NADPH oxidoreductase
MRVSVIGSGMVGEAIADRLLELGHEVRMGSRTPEGPAAQWATRARERASAGDFAQAASFGELVVNATAGSRSLDALRQAGEHNLAGKVLVEVANPINTGGGPGPVTLTVANNVSLAEQIQREFPKARVVKALNTMNCKVMVNPEIVPGEHVVFLSGNEADAKQLVTQLLGSFGRPESRIVDLGDVASARGTDAFLLLWLPLWRALGQGEFNIAIERAR